MKRSMKKFVISSVSMVMALAIILGINLLINKKKASASSATKTGYFNTYNDIVNIEYDSNYTSAQAMNISNSKVWHVKAANEGTANYGKSRIWMYDLSTKKNYVVYNGNTSNYTFQIGHANCMYVGSNALYIATQESGKPSIVKYSIGTSNNKYYLYDKKAFYVYSHNTKVTTPIAVTGINYASELGGFVVKNGLHIYSGNFSGNTFKWTKHYTIDTYLTVKTNDGKTENINAANFVKQGMFYRGGILYIPMTNNNKMNQSIVVAYDLNASTANNAVLKEKNNVFFRITSSKYSKLFEIEDVARHNGYMYANVNATDSTGKTYDRIIKFKDFTF